MVLKILTIASLSLVLTLTQGLCEGGEKNSKIAVTDGHVSFQISGVLQPEDSQFVHDILCAETKENIGTVRMRWAFKYGHRYGGVGVATDGGVECVWKGDGGWVKVKLPPSSTCAEVVVLPRLARIPD